MHEDLLNFSKLALTSRIWRILGLLVVGYVLTVLYIRSSNTMYNAKIKVFVSAPSTHSLSSSMSLAPSGGLAAFEKKDFIQSQRALLTSYPIYESIEAAPTKNDQQSESTSPSALGSFILGAQSLLFGSEYVDSRMRWRDRGFEAFQSRITFHDNAEAGFFEVGYKGSDPREALDKSEALARALIKLNESLVRKRTVNISQFLERKVAEARADLEQSSKQIAVLSKEYASAGNDALMAQSYEQYNRAKEKFKEAQIEAASQKVLAEESLSLLQKLEQKYLKNTTGIDSESALKLREQLIHYKTLLADPSMSGDESVRDELRKRLAHLGNTIEEMGLRYALPNQTIDQIIAETEVNLAQQLAELKAANLQIEMAKENIAVLEQEIEKFPELRAKLGQLMITHDQRTKILQLLTEHLLTSLVRTDAQFDRLYLLDGPTLSNVLSSSKLKLLVIGLAAMTVFVLLGVIVFEVLNGTIFESSQLDTQITKNLGSLPHVAGSFSLIQFSDLETPKRIVHFLATAPGFVDRGQVISLCSGNSAAGKSVSGLAIAHAFSDRNLRVLVIDADYRVKDRTISQYFWKNKSSPHLVETGLAAYTKKITAHPQSTGNGKALHMAQLVPPDTDNEKALHYLMGDFTTDLGMLKNHFDVIIIDGPPLFFADSLYLIGSSDSIILCCREAKANNRQFLKALESVHAAKREDATIYTLLTDAKLSTNSDSAVHGSYTYRYRRKAS